MTPSPPDWPALRRDFAPCAEHAYLITAAVGPVPAPVHAAQQAMAEQLRSLGAMVDGYFFERVEEARAVCARFIDAAPADLAFTPNTSHNMSLLAWALRERHGGGNVVLPADDFPSTILPWQHHGFELRRVPAQRGRLAPEALLERVDAETRAVVTSHVFSFTGFRLDVARLGAALAAQGVPLVVNATQSIGALPVRVREWGVAALSASGHKWLCAGYSGALLYVSPALRETLRWPLTGWLAVDEPFALRTDPDVPTRRDAAVLEVGTKNVLGITALRAACERVEAIGAEAVARRDIALADALVERLEGLGLPVLSPRDGPGADWRGSADSGIVVFTAPRAESLKERLAAERVHVSVRRGNIRAALHYFNDASDLERLCAGLQAHLAEGA